MTNATMGSSDSPAQAGKHTEFLFFLGCLIGLLLLFFWQSLQPAMVLFSNDGPLGPLSAESARFPGLLTGYWADLNWLGIANPTASPNITSLMLWLGPVAYSKFFGPLSLLLLGLSAWFFFRQCGFHPAVCFAGGFAAALNSDFFSYTAWGLGSLTISVAALFLAFAMLARSDSHPWLRAALAGLALGVALMEGYDNGAIFSLYVAAFAVFRALLSAQPLSKAVLLGLGRTVVVAVFAGFLAAHTLLTLVGTQVQGISGTEQDSQSREERWDWATSWSFPKIETLRIVIPGLYGYRMDTPEGGNYWGSMGQDRAWETYFKTGGTIAPPSQGLLRHSGSGPYAGVLVVLLALWAFSQTFRKKDPIYNELETKFIWFWSAAALASLLFAYGRHAPFYQIIYALPYFSTIRIPAKFLHPFSVTIVILFAYGLQGLWRRYVLPVRRGKTLSLSGQVKEWWKTAPAFDRKWMIGAGAVVGAAAISWLIYVSSRSELILHMQRIGFSPELASSMAGFSIREVALFVLLLAVAVAILLLLVSGAVSGARAKAAAALVVGFLVIDLGRANWPWVNYYNYQTKYASNAVIDLLRNQPHQSRVAGLFLGIPDPQGAQLQQQLQEIYQIEWLQHAFQFYNIQSLDVIQMPRVPADTTAFKRAINNITRLWELTNTRFLIGLAPLVPELNRQLDSGRERFRLHAGFTLYQEKADGPILAQITTNGPFGLIEFTGALPRARLYSQWVASTNDQENLARLASPDFDPHKTVVISNAIQPASTNAVAEAGTVEFASYAPKRIVLRANAAAPSVLLLNDRYDPNWKVFVDGQPRELLQANYIMRGVALEPGEHQIEFRFDPPVTGLYISLAVLLAGAGLIVMLVVRR